MTLTEYKKTITETAVFPRKVDDFGLAYCLIGLIDEMDEVIEKVSSETSSKEEIYSEIGDVCWYLCALCNELNIEFESIIENRKHSDENHIFKLFGKIKKYYRDSKPFNSVEIYKILSGFAASLLKDISEEDIIYILQKNHDKLIARRETNTLHGDGDDREKQK